MNIFHFLGTPTQQIQVYCNHDSIYILCRSRSMAISGTDWLEVPTIYKAYCSGLRMIFPGNQTSIFRFGHGDFPLQELTLEGHEAPVLCVACDGQRGAIPAPELGGWVNLGLILWMVGQRNPAPVDRWFIQWFCWGFNHPMWWCRISLAHPQYHGENDDD